MILGRTFSKIVLCLLISTGINLSYTVSVSAFSIMEFLGIGTEEKGKVAETNSQQKQDESTSNNPTPDKMASELAKQDEANPSTNLHKLTDTAQTSG